MNLLEIKELDDSIKLILMQLWNDEYPKTLGMENLSDFESYLDTIEPSSHFLLSDNSNVGGWFVEFTRDKEIWFLMIINRDFQQLGLGLACLSFLKSRNESLNGWVVDHNKYSRIDGSPYPSTISFYVKNEFVVQKDIRLETETLSAVKISWTKSN